MHASLPGFRMPDDEQVQHAADAFRMLSDPTRMKIMWALLQGETSVACLAELVGAAPTAVSQHLSKLRLAGIVRGRRQGTYVYYTAADEHVRRLLAEALFHADHDLERGRGPEGATADRVGPTTPGASLR
jgi:DNA-binding transcriptional ArsR family regulator